MVVKGRRVISEVKFREIREIKEFNEFSVLVNTL